MSQIKGQDKIAEKQLNEVEICNFPEKEFIMIVKMIQYLGNPMEKMQEIFTKDLQELKNRDEQHTRRNKATEAERPTNELQDKQGPLSQNTDRSKGGRKRRQPDNTVKAQRHSQCRGPRRRERQKGPEKTSREIIAKKLP